MQKKIVDFISEHHVLTLSTICNYNSSSCCSMFYEFIHNDNSFIVASDYKTEHIKNIQKNSRVSGTILLETKSVGKIQGIQFKAEMLLSSDEDEYLKYVSKFPYAKLMELTLWKIKLNYVKFTDNRLGFGKKIIWQS